MHRVLALLLVLALIATSGVSFALHTHVYTDHDHPEHQHGLSAHHHNATPTPTRGAESAARLDKCDPAQHTVSFVFACAVSPQFHASHAEAVLQTSLTPQLQIEPKVGDPDARVHGPPSRTQASPRAPPLQFLA